MERDIDSLVRRDAVHRSIYTDPEIFDLEMERIFGQTWVYLAHVGEITQPGDYKTTRLGKHPVIVSRLADGGVAALINRCRHRGATVCQQELGNAQFYSCAYHGWTYANDGRLVGLPASAGFGKSFDRDAMGLAAVPRVAVYRGFIFGSMADDGPGLDEHLGDARRFIDLFCDVSPTGEIEVFRGQQKVAFNGNWKLQLENGVDPYHVQSLHRSMIVGDADKLYSQGRTGSVIDLNGHGVMDYTDIGPLPIDGGLAGGFNIVVFPNLILLRTQIRAVRPIAVNRTEVHTSAVRLPGVSAEINRHRLRSQEFEFGAAGAFYVDDVEAFERVTEGLESDAVEWLVMARGLDRERVEDGHLTSDVTDETQHRGLYRRWKELMTAAPGESDGARISA